MNLDLHLLQAQPQQGNPYSMLILMGGFVIIFYLFFIRPQAKRQRKEKELRSSLQKGQKVVTLAGIHGRIASVDEATVLLEIADGVKMRMEKTAVIRLATETAEEPKK